MVRMELTNSNRPVTVSVVNSESQGGAGDSAQTEISYVSMHFSGLEINKTNTW